MKRVLIFAGAAAVTAVLVGLALMLGDVGFETRRFSLHEGRLKKLVLQQAQVGPVTQGLEDEHARLLGIAQGRAAAADLAHRYGGTRQDEIAAKAERWPHVRVFLAADMIYFIYFDAGGVTRDFTLVSSGAAR